jgi:hypothetical protein
MSRDVDIFVRGNLLQSFCSSLSRGNNPSDVNCIWPQVPLSTGRLTIEIWYGFDGYWNDQTWAPRLMQSNSLELRDPCPTARHNCGGRRLLPDGTTGQSLLIPLPPYECCRP